MIVHEAAHMFFCKLRGVAVLDVRFFGFGNPAGYVSHEEPKDFTTAFLISLGPFFINSLFILAILSMPLVYIIYLANILRFFWLDYLYGIGIGLGLPSLVFQYI